MDAAEGKFAVFGGLNAVSFYEELQAGVVGTMPAGEFPDVAVRIYDLFTQGKKQEAKKVFYQYLPFIRLGNTPGGVAMAVHKEVLRMGGIFSTANVRGPFVPLSDFFRQIVHDCVADMDLLALRWNKG